MVGDARTILTVTVLDKGSSGAGVTGTRWRVRSYLSTTRKQGYSLFCSLERVLSGKPLVFQQTENQSNLSPPGT
jgi:hypothetical protein